MVYRLRVTSARHVENVQGATFHYLDSPTALPWILRAIAGRHRRAALVKTIAKLATSSRQYYCVTIDGAIVSDGWVTLGRCDHYTIEREAALIGPTWTDPDHRGKGLATFALGHAINALHVRGHDLTYIDTSKDNVAMQRVIARCGYGAPIAAFPRDEHTFD
jgi:GNAT superfamily N-acetyltransferase